MFQFFSNIVKNIEVDVFFKKSPKNRIVKNWKTSHREKHRIVKKSEHRPPLPLTLETLITKHLGTKVLEMASLIMNVFVPFAFEWNLQRPFRPRRPWEWIIFAFRPDPTYPAHSNNSNAWKFTTTNNLNARYKNSVKNVIEMHFLQKI